VRRVLEPHGILSRFAFALTSDDVRQAKPFPELYEKAAARFGLAASSTVALEDSPNGLRAAKAAGARCVVVPHVRVPLDELAGADAILPNLASPELFALLGI
jgi:putative hydrolase of the HAD superfamily